MNAFITYEGLPVNSGGGHSLGKKPVEEVYGCVLSFLQNFSNTTNPASRHLTFYSSRDKTYRSWPVIWDLGKAFGIPSRESWDHDGYTQAYYTWKLSPTQLSKAFSRLQQYADLPQNPYGPLVLSCTWHFQFIDPQTREKLPGQDQLPVLDFRTPNSYLYLRLGQKSTISVWFAFPFQELDDYARDYIQSIFQHLPFKPSAKHWRKWRLSSAGKWNPNKLEMEL